MNPAVSKYFASHSCARTASPREAWNSIVAYWEAACWNTGRSFIGSVSEVYAPGITAQVISSTSPEAAGALSNPMYLYPICTYWSGEPLFFRNHGS